MKKFFSALLGVAMIAGLASCGSKGPSVDWKKVWTDPDTEGYVLCGPSQNSVGDSALDWSYKADNILSAVSLNDVKAKDEDLANKLAGMPLKGLYMVSNVKIGYTSAGYTKLGYTVTDKLVMGDGALTMKVCNYSTDEDTGVTAVNTWFPSPEGYTASLTPSVFQEQIHSATPDENGLDHNSDVLVLGGSGVYTVIMAHFSSQIEALDGTKVNYAIGMIQETANPDGQQVSEITPVPVTSVGAIGDFEGSDWTNDVVLTKNGNTYTGTISTQSGNAFKVRANADWTYSWGFDDLTCDTSLLVNDGGNIKTEFGGEIRISITLPETLSPISHSAIEFIVDYLA